MSGIKTFADVDRVALDTKIAMIQRCMRAGMTMKEVAEELGSNQSWISDILAKNGVPWDRQYRNKYKRGRAA